MTKKILSSKSDQYNVEEENKKSQEQTKSDVPPVSFLKLFRYTTACDKFFIFIGILGCGGTGALTPLNTLLFGDLLGSLVDYTKTITNITNSSQIDDANSELMDAISHFAVMNSLIGLGMFILTYVSIETFNYTALRQILKIRSLYLRSVLNQDISWYDVNQTGDFASRMSEDLTKLEDGIGEKIPNFLNAQFVFISSLIMALVKGWELSLICLTSLPLSMIAMGIIQFITAKYGKNELDAYGSAGAIAEEVLTSIRTVIAFGGQKLEVKRYNNKLEYAKKNNIRRAQLFATGFGLLWFFIYGSYALAFWYGTQLVVKYIKGDNSTYSPATMITVFFAVMTGSMNFGFSSPFIEAFGLAKAAGARIFQVIDNEPVINASKKNGEKVANLKGNIKFTNVKFHYPSRKEISILNDLSLEINAGETVALVGSSGCGKSTVIQLLQRYYDPIEGEVTVDGKNLKNLDLTWFRNHIGVVGQEPVLFGTSILENIKYGNRNATEAQITEAAKKANAHEFIKALPNGYNSLVGERGTQLSGGQKQRIAIARALVRNPTILLLDEATSALDNNSEAKVQKAIDSVSKECTTIIIAHRLSTIRGADKIIVMSKGKVVEQGTHAELMSLKGEYFNLVTAQVQGTEPMTPDIDEDTQLVEDQKRSSVISIKKEEDIIFDDNIEQNGSIWPILYKNKPEWLQLFLGCIAACVMGSSMPLFGVILGDVMGALSKPVDEIQDATNIYCVYFAVAGVISGIATFLQIYLFTDAGEKLTKRIRHEMFDVMLKQEIGFFDRKENGVGALCARLSSEAAQVQGATGQRIGTIVQSLATFVLAIGLSMYYNWKLGFVALAFTPVILISMYLQRKQSADDAKGTKNSVENSTKIAVEAVSNIRTVVSLCSEDHFYMLYMAELENHNKKQLLYSHGRSLVMAVSRSIMFFAYAATMYYGGQLIKDGLEYTNVFKVSQTLIMGTMSIANALAFTPNLQKGLKAIQKINMLLNRTPAIIDRANVKEVDLKGNVKLSKIEFNYPTRPNIKILKGLNLDIIQGKTVALVGPSGCGKSTIIQLIERFYDPLSGTVSADGNDLKTIILENLRAQIGIVSQEPNLFSRTIAENIKYGDNSREVDISEVIESAKKSNIHEFIATLPLGYDTKLGEKGTQLSGGQKQRIAIARALVRNPKILLLDEATSALDTESEKVVQEALDKAKEGRTCITIAHRLTTIQDADVICVVNEGVVEEMGRHEELLSQRGLYYKLHSLQNKNK